MPAMNTRIRFAALFCLVTAVAVAADQTMEREVKAVMETFRQAMLSGDAAVMARLLHPDITYCHSSGSTQDKQSVLAKFGAAASFEYSDTTIRIHGSVALVKNVTDMRNAATRDTPNRLNVLYVWVKGAEGWQMIARHPIRLPIPGAPTKGAPR